MVLVGKSGFIRLLSTKYCFEMTRLNWVAPQNDELSGQMFDDRLELVRRN